MARSLDAILKELEPSYAGSRKAIQTQLSALPASIDAQISGLKAQLGQANEDILGAARRRGIGGGFSGIPIAEQAQYAATQFAPALARVQESGNQRRSSLQDALSNLDRDQRQYAMSLRQSELDRDEQRRQFQAQLKAQREAEQRAAQRAVVAQQQSLSAADYLAPYVQQQTQQSQGPTAADRKIFSRARSLVNVYNSNRGMYNSIVSRMSKGNSADRSVVATALKLIKGGVR